MAQITQKFGFDAGKAIDTLERLDGSLGKVNNSLERMKGTGAGAKALGRVDKQVQKTKKSAQDLTISWQTMLRIIQTQVIVRGINLLSETLKESVERARELGLAIEEVRTIDSEGRTAQALSEDLLALSDAIGKAPVDLAEGLYQTLSNQVVEAGEALNFTSEAAKLATVTASETGDAVNALSSVMNSYNLAASEAEHVAGTLFKTVELGRLRLSEIANVIGRVTPLTAQLSITWEETAAAIATMTRQGVRADTAITQLRAVTTRLLKPTDDMLELYRKWGVTDGKQAIETFGGLNGVLAKLEEETGFSSQGMSELLKNVRAITGAFGIMTADGKLVSEVLAEIQEGSKAASEAWEQFAESDAQKLTRSTQEFQNQITRLGAQTMPAVNDVMEGINVRLRLLITGWERINDAIGGTRGATLAANTFAAAVKSGAEEAEQLREQLSEAGKGAYDNLIKASRFYYTDANKLENELQQEREAGIEGATAGLEAASDALLDFYQQNISELEAFANRAQSQIDRLTQSNARTREQIEDRLLDNRLRKETDVYGKIRILQEELAKAEERAAGKFADARVGDKASIKAYEDSKERAIELAERVADLEREGATGIRRDERAQDKILRLQSDLIKGRQTLAKQTELGAQAVEKQVKVEEDAKARLTELAKQEAEIRKDSVITPEEEAALERIRQKRQQINEEVARGATLLEGFGLQQNFDEVVTGLTDALNTAQKDWVSEVDRFEAELLRRKLEIRFSLDTQGTGQRFAETAGLQDIPGEGEADRARRINEAAKGVLDVNREIAADLQALETSISDPIDAIALSMEHATANFNNARTNLDELARQETMGEVNIFSDVEAVQARIRAEMENRVQLQGALNAKIGEYLTKLREGQPVSQQELTALQQTVERVKERGLLLTNEKGIYGEVAKQLAFVADKQSEINEKKKASPDPEIVQAAAEHLNYQNQIADRGEDENQAAASAADNRERAKGIIDSILGPQQAVKEETGATADEAERGGEATLQIGQNAVSIIPQINQTTQAMAQLKAEAQAAAAAVASASGGGGSVVQNPFAQYHGGPTYLANGGFARGQDRIAAALAPGETVINRKQSGRFFSELNAMNQGSTPVYREQGGPVTNVGDVNVSVQGGDSSQQTVREIGHALRREIQRGNIKLR